MEEFERDLLNGISESGTSIHDIRNKSYESFENSRLDENFMGPARPDSRMLVGEFDMGKKNDPMTCSSGRSNFDVKNFVKDLETNLENFESEPAVVAPISESKKKKKKNKKEKKNSSMSDKCSVFIQEIKEPFIIVLLFILLNQRSIRDYITEIPVFAKMNSPYPSLIIRGIILATLIYLLKKWV